MAGYLPAERHSVALTRLSAISWHFSVSAISWHLSIRHARETERRAGRVLWGVVDEVDGFSRQLTDGLRIREVAIGGTGAKTACGPSSIPDSRPPSAGQGRAPVPPAHVALWREARPFAPSIKGRPPPVLGSKAQLTERPHSTSLTRNHWPARVRNPASGGNPPPETAV